MQISGFQVVPVSLGEGKDGQTVIHYIYIKQHGATQKKDEDSSDDEESSSAGPSASSAFLLNLPHDTTLDNLKDLCEVYGHVVMESFEYHGRHRGVLRLVDSSACQRFLSKLKKAGKGGSVMEWNEYGPRGAEAYFARNAARFPSERDLLDQADEYMEAYNELEESQKLEAARAGELVDEDGFTLVVGQGRKSLSDIPKLPAAPKRKRKALEKKDFYRFQLREKQKDEMNSLLRRYKEDKERVEDLKRRKMLKPF